MFIQLVLRRLQEVNGLFLCLFGLYGADYFDKVVLFNSGICVSEYFVWVNCSWQIFVSSDFISLFLFFIFFLFL